jgi:hypothetical protein
MRSLQFAHDQQKMEQVKGSMCIAIIANAAILAIQQENARAKTLRIKAFEE